MTPPHFLHYRDVPTRFDLELDPLITQTEISIDTLEKMFRCRLNAETHANRNPIACAADQLRQRLALQTRKQVHVRQFQTCLRHVVPAKRSEAARQIVDVAHRLGQ